jgi:hypothetical protein
MNEWASEHMHCHNETRVISGASHLFEERGKLREVADIATDWFREHMAVEQEKALETARALRLS